MCLQIQELRFIYILFSSLVLILFVAIAMLVILVRKRQNELLLQHQLDQQIHQNQLLEKELEAKVAIEKERERISLDIHDDLGASLSAIKLKAEFLHQQISDDYIQQNLQDIAHNAQDVALNMREMIWALTSENDTLENFILYIRNYIRHYFEDSRIDVHIDIPIIHENPVLNGYVRRQLFLCVKESCHNILKHSQAKNMKFVLNISQEMIIILQDDGIGLSNTHRRGNGLVSMQKRMESIDGRCDIRCLDSGTEVRLEYSLS